MSVYLDGATLSALLFSFLNSSGSQYGFLIGERIEHIEDSISDSQILTYNVNSYIYISSFLPWPSEESIYSREGHFREEWIKRCMPKSEHTLVGWYSFRHNTSGRPSLREITLHNSLSTSEAIAAQANELLFFLCTSAFSSNMSTHTCSHGFLRSIDGHFVPVPMSVMNLGDTTRKEYKKRSSVALSHCKTVQESFHTFKKGFLKSSGESEQITKMSHLATSINKTLMSIHHRVFESEAVLGLLETDVSMLRQRLGRLEQEETKTAQIEAEKRHYERDEARRTKSVGELGLRPTDVSVFRHRIGWFEQEKIKTAQKEAEKRQRERDEAKRTKSAGELGLTQTDVSVLRQRLGWFGQEEIKTAQIEAEKRQHERDEAKRTKSAGELGLTQTDVSVLRQRLGWFGQEEIKTAQIEAEKRQHERDEAKRTKSAGELGLTQTDVSVLRQRLGWFGQEEIKTAQIEAEKRQHERDEAKRTKSAGELGLRQTDVSVLRQRLGWFEQEEIKTAQIEAEKRQHERDEARRKKSEADEQEQLEKLLIELGIWPSNNCVGASDIRHCAHHTASFPVEQYFNNEDEFASYQVVNLVPSVPTMQACGNSSSGRNQECVARNISLTKQTVGEQRVATRVQDKPCEIKKPQTVKDKVSEAFSFLDEELQLSKVGASPQRQQVESLQTSRCTGRLCNKAGDNEHRVCIRELSRNTDNPGVSDPRKVNNYTLPLVKVLNDNVNATSSNMRVGENSGIHY